MGSTPYTVKITKTLVVDMIPHQQPALMGTVNVSPGNLIFDFAVEQLPGCDDVNIELSPNFDTTIYFVPDMLTELRASPPRHRFCNASRHRLKLIITLFYHH